jgi:hypothetical protein
MTARAFALTAIAFAVACLVGTMAVNVGLDPEAVFNPARASDRVNANTRYLRYLDYKALDPRPDGVLFGSSRGNHFDRDALARHMGLNRVAGFAVNFGMVSDHLPALDYVIRDKVARGETLKAAVVMLDVDHFGKAAWTNTNLDGFLPPEISGEPPARFWWRNLTAFQPRVWFSTLRGRPAPPPPEQAGGKDEAASPPMPTDRKDGAAPPAQRSPARRPTVVARPQLEAQLAMLGRIAALCRDNGIRLVVVTSPLSRTNLRDYNPAELARVTARISAVVPVWDFGAPDWLSDRSDLWFDPSHFHDEVSRMMLARMFGSPGARPGFGTLRGG